MFIARTIQSKLLSLSKQYPVLTLTGPRQSGKTTLVKKTFPKLPYFSLEKPDVLDFALADPNEFLKQADNGAILDEIQNAPRLLSYIQGIVDESKKDGQFILTGSQQFQLMKGVTQSLAGRTAVLKLLPLSIAEATKKNESKGINDYLLNGFYPQIWGKQIEPYQLYSDYFETYIQRDLRDLIRVKDLSLFRKFVRLCAGRTGQIFNASHLSSDIGVSTPTIQSWLSILESSYIVYLLEPYYENFGKRLIKSPKLYFYDVGLACFLLGIENLKQLERDPLRGALVENLVVIELLKKRFNAAKQSNLYFYRDNHQNEVDILLKFGHEFKAIEIKASGTFHESFIKGNEFLGKLLDERLIEKAVVYCGDLEIVYKGNKVLNFMHASSLNE